MAKSIYAVTWMLPALALGLSACGGGDKAAESSPEKVATPSKTAAAPTSAPSALNLAAGPDVCFKAIAKHLGSDTKVSEITSFFSGGADLESGSSAEPEGTMSLCKVDYQSPDDPRKLVSTSMDVKTGEFSAPQQMEITVMGDAAAFRLEDHLIPLSQVNAAALTEIMESEKAKLASVYSRHVWTGVRLMGPDAFNEAHTLRLDVEGRLAANDIKNSGYASVSIDGKKVTADHLMP